MTSTNGHSADKLSHLTPHRMMFMLITGAAALFYLFREPIFLGTTLIGPEIWSQGVAVNDYAFSSLKNGVLPLWRTEIDLGHPIIGEPAFSYWLHPINMLFLFLPAYTAINYLVMAHYALSLLFTYLFGRSLGLNSLGAYMSALVYTFSAIMTSQADQYSVAPAMVWLPLILLFINMAYKREDARFFALAGIVYGFQFFQSHLQFWSYTFVMAALFTASKAFMNLGASKSPLREASFAAKGMALVLGAGLGIAAIKFLPLLELSGHGGRIESGDGGMSFLTSSYYSMKLSDLILLFFPDIYGAHLTVGFEGFNSEYSVERFCYIGVATLVFAIAGMAAGKNRHKRFFAYVAVFSVLFAMGRDIPLYFLQYHLVPGFDNFQIPLRYLYLFSFSGAILAGICVDAVSSNDCLAAQKDKMSRIGGHFTIFLVVTAAVIILIGLLLAPYAVALNKLMPSISGAYAAELESFAKAPLESLLSIGFYVKIWPGFLLSTHFLGLVLIVAVLFLFSYRRRIAADKRLIFVLHAGAVLTALGVLFHSGSFPENVASERISRQILILIAVLLCFYLWKINAIKGTAFGYLMVLAVLIDLIGQNSRYINTIDRSFYSTYPKSIEFIKKDGSLFRVNYAIGDEYKKRHRLQSYTLDDGTYFKWREALSTSFVYGGIYVWKGMDGKPSIGIQRQNALHHEFERDYMEKTPSEQAIKILSLLNVKYLIRTGELSSKGLESVYSDAEGVRIYENKKAIPRAFTVAGYTVLEKDKVLDFMKSEKFDPQKLVVLEEADGLPTEPARPGQGPACDRAEVRDYSQNKVSIDTKCGRAGFLVLSDSYYPGWKAYMDGKETKIYLANYVMRSVFLPAGRHTVEFRYQPNMFRAGAVISAATLAALGLYFSLPFWRRASAARAA